MSSPLDTLGKSYAGDRRLVLTKIIINSFLEGAESWLGVEDHLGEGHSL